jgi:hypothetical protein
MAAIVSSMRCVLIVQHVWGAPKSFGEQVFSHVYDVFTAFLAGGIRIRVMRFSAGNWKRPKS